MTKLIQVGFFRELKGGDKNGPSLRAAVADTAGADEEKIIRYLRAGSLYIGSPGVVKDVLSESSRVIGSPDYLTDGVYTWRGDLAYYVEKYHVRPPQDFVDHMARSQWQVPPQIDLMQLEL